MPVCAMNAETDATLREVIGARSGGKANRHLAQQALRRAGPAYPRNKNQIGNANARHLALA